MRFKRSTIGASAALVLLLSSGGLTLAQADEPDATPSPVATPEPSGSPSAPPQTDSGCAACDVDGDGVVGAGDARIVASLLDTDVTVPEADVNGDGTTDWADLELIVGHHGETVGAGSQQDPDAEPVGSAGQARPLPDKIVAVYHMMWPDSKSPRLLETPREVNVVNLAFFDGTTMSLPGWASQNEEQFLADAHKLRERGVRFVLSVGGEKGKVDLSDRQAFIDGVMAINAKLPLDGLDWDIEGQELDKEAMIAVSTDLVERRGPHFTISFAPGGGNIDEYRPIPAELHEKSINVLVSQQFYDAEDITAEDVIGRTQQLIDAGIPQSSIGIGMKTGDDNETWTPDEAAAHTRAVKEAFPDIRGGFLWEAGRPGTEEWVSKLAPVLKD